MKRYLAFFVTILAIVTWLTVPAFAQAGVNGFVVTNFTADETLSRADPQGELHIVEHINVDFTAYNHGILRAIPWRYKGHSLQLHVNSITSDSGAPTKYSSSISNGNTVLKIGDPKQTVTGAQEYTIDYTLRNVISFYGDHDELYWDINGDQWPQPFNQVQLKLHLPADLRLTNQAPLCYAGAYGSTAANCTIQLDPQTHTIAASASNLGSYQTLTIVTGFNKGYFTPSTWRDTLGEYLPTILELVLPMLVLGGVAFVYWLLRGRDPKGRGVIVPQYGPPDNLKPIEVGTILDFKTDSKDLTATIIDLAVRGYIKIIETDKKSLLGKTYQNYQLELRNADWASLPPIEQQLMLAIFQNNAVGTSVDMSDLKNKLYTAANQISKQTEQGLTANGYFRSNPLKRPKVFAGMSLLVGAIFFIAVVTRSISPILIVGCFLGLFIAGIFGRFMAARTAKGVAALESIKGLKMYMQVAEADRLKMLQSPNAPYADGANQPVKTVDLFEKLLPYAIVLGVEKEWAQQFADIYQAPPDWYGGNFATFNAIYLASHLGAGMSAGMQTAFASPTSSSSSGFGGGGFDGAG